MWFAVLVWVHDVETGQLRVTARPSHRDAGLILNPRHFGLSIPNSFPHSHNQSNVLKKKKRERERNRGLFPKKPETMEEGNRFLTCFQTCFLWDMPYNTPGSQKPWAKGFYPAELSWNFNSATFLLCDFGRISLSIKWGVPTGFPVTFPSRKVCVH